MAFPQTQAVAGTTLPSKQRQAPIVGDGTNKYSDAIFFLLQIVFFIAAANWWFNWGEKRGLFSQTLWIFFAEIGAAVYVHTLCHELGRLFAGWAADMKLRAFLVGPLSFTCRNSKWGCEFKLKGLWGAGAVDFVPTHLRDLHRRRIFMAAAGPVASLITAILATAFALTAPGNPWAPAWYFFSMLATLAWSGSVFNALPTRLLAQYADGAQIYQLLSKSQLADFHMVLWMVSSSLVTPLRPRDFHPAILNRAAAFMAAGKSGMLLNLYLYMHHCDGGRLAEGLHHFEIAESMYPQIAGEFEADLHLEFVYGNAAVKHDLAAAHLWWERMEAKGKTRDKINYWKARAAMLWIEGSIAQAREAWRNADAWARQMPSAGAYDRHRDDIAQLGALLDAAEMPKQL